MGAVEEYPLPEETIVAPVTFPLSLSNIAVAVAVTPQSSDGSAIVTVG